MSGWGNFGLPSSLQLTERVSQVKISRVAMIRLHRPFTDCYAARGVMLLRKPLLEDVSINMRGTCIGAPESNAARAAENDAAVRSCAALKRAASSISICASTRARSPSRLTMHMKGGHPGDVAASFPHLDQQHSFVDMFSKVIPTRPGDMVRCPD